MCLGVQKKEKKWEFYSSALTSLGINSERLDEKKEEEKANVRERKRPL
jgi:hypothetical protein